MSYVVISSRHLRDNRWDIMGRAFSRLYLTNDQSKKLIKQLGDLGLRHEMLENGTIRFNLTDMADRDYCHLFITVEGDSVYVQKISRRELALMKTVAPSHALQDKLFELIESPTDYIKDIDRSVTLDATAAPVVVEPFVSSLDYNFDVNGNHKESVLLTGNTHYWNEEAHNKYLAELEAEKKKEEPEVKKINFREFL